MILKPLFIWKNYWMNDFCFLNEIETIVHLKKLLKNEWMILLICMNDSMTLTLLLIIYVTAIIFNGFANNCFKNP